MNIEIADTLPYTEALDSFRLQWAMKQVKGNGNINQAAHRVRLSRKGLQLLLQESLREKEKVKMGLGVCMFCNSDTDLTMHHVDGINHSVAVTAICSHCHQAFHRLNERYRP